MPAVMGVETEYGVLAPQVPDLDPYLLSTAVVLGWPGPATHTTLDFDDPLPIEDLHNRILGNGARFYVDHAHPEYSGPEVTSAAAAVSYDLAGDRIVAAAAQAASRRLGTPVRIFKNNTDSHGASYGCHENYLLARSTPWRRILRQFTGYLVSRTIVSGAGRLGRGQHGERPGFQLSQRADFFETLEGIQTTRNRPIVNTRDEPHAPPQHYRRLHVITGDANRSAWSTWLKVGGAAAVLAALEADALPEFELADPVAALHSISHEPHHPVPLADGRTITAAALQAGINRLHEREIEPAVRAGVAALVAFCVAGVGGYAIGHAVGDDHGPQQSIARHDEGGMRGEHGRGDAEGFGGRPERAPGGDRSEQRGNEDGSDKGMTRERPDHGSTERPDHGSTERPDQGSTERPDQGSTERPERDSAERPGKGSTESPDRGSATPQQSSASAGL